MGAFPGMPGMGGPMNMPPPMNMPMSGAVNMQ